MARRRELKNIASGLSSSFVSRNNDYDGYWELARLYDFANSEGVSEIKIDLLNSKVSPSTRNFDFLLGMMWL